MAHNATSIDSEVAIRIRHRVFAGLLMRRKKRLSHSKDADFFDDALREALATYGEPEIFNADQGSQYTSGAWIDVRVDAGIEISMDGKGATRDNRTIVAVVDV